MFDLNCEPAPERQEDQGQQSKRPRDKSPSRSVETSQERLNKRTRFVRMVSESSVEQVGPAVGDQSHFERSEQVHESAEQQNVPRKRKYEWKSTENRDMLSQNMKKRWENPEYQKKMSEKRKKQLEESLNKKFKGNQTKIEAFKRMREKKRTLQMQWEREEKQRQ